MEDKEGSTILLGHGLFPRTMASNKVEVFTRKVEIMKNQLQAVNEKIVQLKENEEKYKVGCGGIDKGKKIETEKQTCIDRLNKKLVALNTKNSHNRELRQKIDEMRQERCRLDVIYTKLERDVKGQTDQMSMVLEEGKKAMKARDNAIGELKALNKHLEDGRR